MSLAFEVRSLLKAAFVVLFSWTLSVFASEKNEKFCEVAYNHFIFDELLKCSMNHSFIKVTLYKGSKFSFLVSSFRNFRISKF